MPSNGYKQIKKNLDGGVILEGPSTLLRFVFVCLISQFSVHTVTPGDDILSMSVCSIRVNVRA